MFDKRVIIVAAVLTLIAIQLDGLTRNEVREQFRCRLRRRTTTTTVDPGPDPTTTTTIPPTTVLGPLHSHATKVICHQARFL